MTSFDRDVVQVIEFMAQYDPGVVVALNEDRRIVFIGGEAARSVSEIITVGEYLDASRLAGSNGFEDFVDALIHSESSISGKYESRIENGPEILWQGHYLEDSGIVVLKGNVLARSCEFCPESLVEIDALKEKERMLSTLLGNLPGMAYRCRNDVDWTMEFISEGCLELTGYESEALLGNLEVSYADLILPEYRAHVWECVQEAVQEQERIEMVYKIRTRSGEEKWVWEKGVDVIRDGELVALEGFITDITPRVMAEQALQKSEERYRLMAEKTGQMVYDYDLESGEVAWSGAVEEISGCTEKDFQEVDIYGWGQLIHPDDRDNVLEELAQCISEARSFLSLYRFRRRDGNYLYVEDEGDFLTDAGGKAIRMIGTVKNYSDKMKLQELMIQSEKMTTVASLSAGMAHEINNPLGVISQSAQNIERRLLPEMAKNREVAAEVGISLDDIKQYLDKRQISPMLKAIKEASSRAARIVVNMLDFSRKSEEKKELCRLEEIVERVLEAAYTDFTPDKGCDFTKVEVVKDYQEGLPEIMCFPTEMEHVFSNIFLNAAQAMETAKTAYPKIRIKISSDNAYIRIKISDNGPGMNESTRKKVFEPFFSTKADRIGNGLGLSIAYFSVTRNHGGAISLESRPGLGTKFLIILPRGAVGDFYSQSRS